MPPIQDVNGPSNSSTSASSHVPAHEHGINQKDIQSSNPGLDNPYKFEAIDHKGIVHPRVAVHVGGRNRSIVSRRFVEDLGYLALPLTPTLRSQLRDAEYGFAKIDRFVSLKVHGALPGAPFLDLSFGVLSEEHQLDGFDIYIGEETQKRIGRIRGVSTNNTDLMCRATRDWEKLVALGTPAYGKERLNLQPSSITSGSSQKDDDEMTSSLEYEEAGLVNNDLLNAIQEPILDSVDSHSGSGSALVSTPQGPPQSSVTSSTVSSKASSCSTQAKSVYPVKIIYEESIDRQLLPRNYTSKARRIYTGAPDVS